MRITEYAFGRVRIDGHRYTDDVVVLPEGVRAPWWREEGHLLRPGDLEDLKPGGTLVVGTGASGNLRVPDGTLEALARQGWDVQVAPTAEAVEIFNRLDAAGERATAALHLTC